jgi:hypothetical protein
MTFIRCKKHPDIVMYGAKYGEFIGLRCRVCEEIRPLKKEIQDLRWRASSVRHYDDPGRGVCDACTVCRAEGDITLFDWRIKLCRSCLGIVRSKMKTLFKAMEKRAVDLNLKRGVTR